MKPLVIYHASCVDGFGAAFAAWLKLGDDAEYVACQYGESLARPGNLDGRDVYILDFSFPKHHMDYIFQYAKRVVWLDHHKSAFEMWCGGIPEDSVYMCSIGGIDQGHFIRLHNEKSGAMLAWEYFHPSSEIPMLIKHIDDYDRWQFKLEGTKAFNKALWSYAPWSFHQWKGAFLDDPADRTGLSDIGIFDLRKDGEAILRAHDQNVQSVVKGAARKCVIQPFNLGPEPWSNIGLATNCPPHLTSDVGHELATQSGTFGLLWYINKDGKCLCSLRSNGDYDVSVIAKAFGGGGHKNAAGFETDIQTLLEWIK